MSRHKKELDGVFQNENGLWLPSPFFNARKLSVSQNAPEEVSSVLDWGDEAHTRLTRTIRWGDEVLAKLDHGDDGSVPPELLGEIEDWSESTAFFINFILDEDSRDHLETLEFDHVEQVPTDNLAEYDESRIRAEMAMRVTMLKKWFDDLMKHLCDLESLHLKTLGILAEDESASAPILRASLQMRLKIEKRRMVDALKYLRRQGLLEYRESEDVAIITESGRTYLKKVNSMNKSASSYRPKDLIFFCYAREDFDTVEAIHEYVDNLNHNTWWDHKNLIPGQDWDHEIATAIEDAAVCIVFLSSSSVEKTGYVNREIKRILDKMEMMPEGKVFIMPFRLDDCPIPRRLNKWQVLDHAADDWKQRLHAGIRNAL